MFTNFQCRLELSFDPAVQSIRIEHLQHHTLFIWMELRYRRHKMEFYEPLGLEIL